MRFNGQWLTCDDGEIRPVFRGDVLGSDGKWHVFEFLVDTGADRTVFCASVLKTLKLPILSSTSQVGGLGGIANTVALNAQLRLTRDDGTKASFRSEYAALTEVDALDMSVLGRDILDMFALIVDRRADILAILGGQHRYRIEQG